MLNGLLSIPDGDWTKLYEKFQRSSLKGRPIE
jgi:hypothetical protein